MDGLRPLDIGQRAKPVAIDRRKLEIALVGGLGHLLGEPRLDPGRLARQEQFRIGDQVGIILLADAVDARRRAAADLVQQARPGPGREKAVRTASQQEQFLQRIEGRGDRSGACERPVILALDAPRAAMLADLRIIMVLAQQDEGEAFVVAQQDIVGRSEALDQLRFEQQRLGLGLGGDDGHAARLADHPLQPLGQFRDLGVAVDAVLEHPRLADIQDVAARILHAIDAGPGRQCFQDVADRLYARVEVGRAVAADRIGRFLFVEALGSAGLVGAVGLAHRPDLGGRRALGKVRPRRGPLPRRRASTRPPPRNGSRSCHRSAGHWRERRPRAPARCSPAPPRRPSACRAR